MYVKVHPGRDLVRVTFALFIISESASGVIDPFLNSLTLATVLKQPIEVAYKVPRVSF